MAGSPHLCHWIGLDGCPVFDKLWHLPLCTVAPVPLGRLTQSATSVRESFCIFVSLPFLLLFLTFPVWRWGSWPNGSQCGSQMAPALVCSSSGCFPNLFRSTAHSVFGLFSLLIVRVLLPPSAAGSSVTQPVSRNTSESVKSAACRTCSPGMRAFCLS